MLFVLGMIAYSFVCVILILFVLVRPAEGGGGLGGAFGGGGGGESAFGVKAMQTLDKVIAWVSVIMLLLAILMAFAAKA
jgi:protein translocase SecG subunit